MPKKEYREDGETCLVTFELPAEAGAQEAYLCGEFNSWDQTCQPMTAREDGSFSLTLELRAGRSYRYRYVLDGANWVNDWLADGYQVNPYGSEDSVVEV